MEEYLTIYYIHCPHKDILTTERSSHYCEECNDWINGDEVGDINIRGEVGGDIVVRGSGYIPPNQDS